MTHHERFLAILLLLLGIECRHHRQLDSSYGNPPVSLPLFFLPLLPSPFPPLLLLPLPSPPSPPLLHTGDLRQGHWSTVFDPLLLLPSILLPLPFLPSLLLSFLFFLLPLLPLFSSQPNPPQSHSLLPFPPCLPYLSLLIHFSLPPPSPPSFPSSSSSYSPIPLISPSTKPDPVLPSPTSLFLPLLLFFFSSSLFQPIAWVLGP